MCSSGSRLSYRRTKYPNSSSLCFEKSTKPNQTKITTLIKRAQAAPVSQMSLPEGPREAADACWAGVRLWSWREAPAPGNGQLQGEGYRRFIFHTRTAELSRASRQQAVCLPAFPDGFGVRQIISSNVVKKIRLKSFVSSCCNSSIKQSLRAVGFAPSLALPAAP